jgi:hypothetical protein
MKSVEGVKISGYGEDQVAEDLQSYGSVSDNALDHLRTARQVGAEVQVKNTGKICETNRTVVTITRDACLDKHTGLTSMLYLSESILFELQNAINHMKFRQLRTKARGGHISVLQYGLGMADLEYEATTKIVQILTQIKSAGRPISPWGEAQFAGYAQGRVNFGNQPHDPNAADEQRLPTKLFYDYLYLMGLKVVKNMNTAVLKKLGTVRKGPMELPNFKWSKLKSDWGRDYSNKTPAQFFVSYIEALRWLGNETGWSVNWEGGTIAEWKVCATEFERRIPAVKPDRRMTEKIKKGIEGLI